MIGPSEEDIRDKVKEISAQLIGEMDRGEIEDAIARCPGFIFNDWQRAIKTRSACALGGLLLAELDNYVRTRAMSGALAWIREQELDANQPDGDKKHDESI